MDSGGMLRFGPKSRGRLDPPRGRGGRYLYSSTPRMS
jgi:hypothetical protein